MISFEPVYWLKNWVKRNIQNWGCREEPHRAFRSRCPNPLIRFDSTGWMIYPLIQQHGCDKTKVIHGAVTAGQDLIIRAVAGRKQWRQWPQIQLWNDPNWVKFKLSVTTNQSFLEQNATSHCTYSVCYLLDAGILARYVFTQPVKLSMVTINAFDVLKVKTRF